MMRKSLKLIAISVAAILYTSCEKEVITLSDAGDKSIPKVVSAELSYFNNVLLPMMKTDCGSCHTSGSKNFLAGDDNTIHTTLLTKKTSGNVAWIDTIAPTSSYMYTKLKGSHSSKPNASAVADSIASWASKFNK